MIILKHIFNIPMNKDLLYLFINQICSGVVDLNLSSTIRFS